MLSPMLRLPTISGIAYMVMLPTSASSNYPEVTYFQRAILLGLSTIFAIIVHGVAWSSNQTSRDFFKDTLCCSQYARMYCISGG